MTPNNTDSTKPKESVRRGQEFIGELNKKMTRIAQEFAIGDINRAQFQHLYDRYQRQILAVAQIIAESDPSRWLDAVQESEHETTMLIKETLAAKIIGFSIYMNKSGMPIETEGEFRLDAELIVPMLSSYRSATAEIFEANVSSTQLENGHWLYFIGGEFSTLIALFSLEPAANQLPYVQQIHGDYETANKSVFESDEDIDGVVMSFYDLIGTSEMLSEKLRKPSPEEPS